MKERPILFSAPMVRAILDGTKTQTRRVVKPQPPAKVSSIYLPFKQEPNNWQGFADSDGLIHWYGRCPYGQPGDRLWVREAWRWVCPDDPDTAIYRADGHAASKLPPGFKWKPSIHMPWAASRITLEITAVRVERLQAISEADAEAEGCCTPLRGHDDDFARGCYRNLWEQINGVGSWTANPWVWVIEFKRVKP